MSGFLQGGWRVRSAAVKAADVTDGSPAVARVPMPQTDKPAPCGVIAHLPTKEDLE